jgi:hypothetical protein
VADGEWNEIICTSRLRPIFGPATSPTKPSQRSLQSAGSRQHASVLRSPTVTNWKPSISTSQQRRGGVTETVIKVDQVIPDESDGRARWRVTTGPLRLQPSVFDNTAIINTCFSGGRGRAIACIDVRTQLTIAAVAFHIDKRQAAGVQLRRIALPNDATRVDVAHGCVRILKEFLHHLSRELGFGGAVGYRPTSDADKRRAMILYGFRPASSPKGEKPSKIYLVQPDV